MHMFVCRERHVDRMWVSVRGKTLSHSVSGNYEYSPRGEFVDMSVDRLFSNSDTRRDSDATK